MLDRFVEVLLATALTCAYIDAELNRIPSERAISTHSWQTSRMKRDRTGLLRSFPLGTRNTAVTGLMHALTTALAHITRQMSLLTVTGIPAFEKMRASLAAPV